MPLITLSFDYAKHTGRTYPQEAEALQLELKHVQEMMKEYYRSQLDSCMNLMESAGVLNQLIIVNKQDTFLILEGGEEAFTKLSGFVHSRNLGRLTNESEADDFQHYDFLS